MYAQKEAVWGRAAVWGGAPPYRNHFIGRASSGCQHCSHLETVEHILFHCTKYSQERNQLFQSFRTVNQNNFTMQGLLGKTSSNIYHLIIKFLRDTDLAKRI